MRVTTRAALALAVAAVGAAPVAASTSADALIRPGKGIWKARLGMTEAELRRAAGKPLAVVRGRGGFGRVTAEYQYADFTLFVQLRGPRGKLRVHRIATLDASERTPEGVRIGTHRNTLFARYRSRLRCAKPTTMRAPDGRVFVTGQTCTLPASGARTVFLLGGEVGNNPYWGPRAPYVSEWPRVARVGQVSVEFAA